MDNLIWGFDYDIEKYTMAEISFYLLVTAIIAVIVGKYAERQKAENQYLVLIRYRMQRKWWRVQCAKMAGLVGALVVGLMGVYLMVSPTRQKGIVIPLVMWYLAFLTFAMLLKSVAGMPTGTKVVYLTTAAVELISIYAEPLRVSRTFAKWLPGSYLMFRRYEKGFRDPVLVGIFIVEMLFSLAVCFMGYTRKEKWKM